MAPIKIKKRGSNVFLYASSVCVCVHVLNGQAYKRINVYVKKRQIYRLLCVCVCVCDAIPKTSYRFSIASRQIPRDWPLTHLPTPPPPKKKTKKENKTI